MPAYSIGQGIQSSIGGHEVLPHSYVNPGMPLPVSRLAPDLPHPRRQIRSSTPSNFLQRAGGRLRHVGNHQSQTARQPLRLAGIHPFLSRQDIPPLYPLPTATRLHPAQPNWQGFPPPQPKDHLPGLQVLSTDPGKFSRLLVNCTQHILTSQVSNILGGIPPSPA